MNALVKYFTTKYPEKKILGLRCRNIHFGTVENISLFHLTRRFHSWLLKKNSLLSVPWVLIRNRWWIRCLKIVLNVEKKVIQSFYKIHVHLISAIQLTWLGKKNRSRNDVHSICNRQWFSDYNLKFLLVDWIDDSCAYFLLQWCGIFDGGLWRSKQFTV